MSENVKNNLSSFDESHALPSVSSRTNSFQKAVMKIHIGEINIIPIKPKGSLVGFASCVIAKAFYVGGIAIHYDKLNQGFRLVFPVKRCKNDAEIPLFHPINREAGDLIQRAIVIEWENFIKREYF